MNNEKIILTQIKTEKDSDNLIDPKLDGFYIQKFIEKLQMNNLEKDAINNILSNAYKVISFYKKPINNPILNEPTKILCLGKVQSGKTTFFLSAIALAFDNGYDIAYIIAGSKINLKLQTYERVNNSFDNNEKIKIFNLEKNFNEDIFKYIEDGFKIIFIILKNYSKTSNLNHLKQVSSLYYKIPSLIIDDEADEYTPGIITKKGNNSGKIHNEIVEIIKNIQISTFLSITATPHALLLLPINDNISPNSIILVNPGDSYTGAKVFFDTENNPHIRIIDDEDDFKQSIPNSFKEALYFFIFGCCLKRNMNDYLPLSMLVHPSSLNSVQENVANNIRNYINNVIISSIKDKESLQYNAFLDEIFKIYNLYINQNPTFKYSFENIVEKLEETISNLKVNVINSVNKFENQDDNFLYNIDVGGNILGRGLTIDRLIVSYIYRDSKVSQVDTMYQRCRWFGYKEKYLDICKVYMTSELQKKFMSIMSNEEYMWDSINTFLENEKDLKKFPRVFELNTNKLLLTRKSISNTKEILDTNSTLKIDKCIYLENEEKENNRNVYNDYCKKYEYKGILIDFDSSDNHNQQHLLMKVNFIDFYEEFLSKLKFGYGSKFNLIMFQNIIKKIKENQFPKEILLMFMRYGKGEFRSPVNSTETNIKELLQGRNELTKFSGDRYPIDINGKNYSQVPFIQIHMVDINNRIPDLSNSIPLLFYNDPITKEEIKLRLVTGDNIYE